MKKDNPTRAKAYKFGILYCIDDKYRGKFYEGRGLTPEGALINTLNLRGTGFSIGVEGCRIDVKNGEETLITFVWEES